MVTKIKTVETDQCNSWRCVAFLSLACLVIVEGVKYKGRIGEQRTETWKERSTAKQTTPEHHRN
jgi:hypothetical protein